MIFKFPKSLRILRQFEYKKIFRYGHQKAGRYLMIDFIFGASLNPKLGLTVTKKYGKAHKRNRFKRVTREAFRLCQHRLPKNIEMNVRPKASAEHADPTMIEHEMMELLEHYANKSEQFAGAGPAVKRYQSRSPQS